MIQAARLLRLADFLDALPEDRFSFDVWASYDWTDSQCGTSACALGWATTIPEFRALGLCMKVDPAEEWKSPVLDTCTKPTWEATCDATREIFGLDKEMTQYLFVANNGEDHGYGPQLFDDATASEVADHIREFVAREA